MGASLDDTFNAVGVLGGVILAGALLPQIYLAHRRKSTKDISFIWQAVYTAGLLTLMAYYAHFGLWPVFYPMAFEFTCLLYLTGLKTYYEVLVPRATTAIAELDLAPSGRDGRILPTATLGVGDPSCCGCKQNLSGRSAGSAVGGDAEQIPKGAGSEENISQGNEQV